MEGLLCAAPPRYSLFPLLLLLIRGEWKDIVDANQGRGGQAHSKPSASTTLSTQPPERRADRVTPANIHIAPRGMNFDLLTTVWSAQWCGENCPSRPLSYIPTEASDMTS
jgi:hypothetical protein